MMCMWYGAVRLCRITRHCLAVKMVIAVGGYSTYLAVILVSAYGICSAYRGLKKTVAKTIRRWLFEGDSAA